MTSFSNAADKALTVDERQAFLARFPTYEGAHVADILEILENGDAHLDVIESMYFEHGQEVAEEGLLVTATLLRLGIVGKADQVTWEGVQELIERIRAQSK